MSIYKSWLNPANLPTVNQQNFPCLAHRFTVNDIAPNGLSIVDPVTGLTFSNSGPGFLKNGNGFYASGSTTWLQAGNWIAPGTKAVLLLAAGNLPVGFSFGFGDPQGVTFVSSSMNGGPNASKDVSDYATYTAIAGAPFAATAVKVDIPNDAVKTFALPATGAVAVSNAAAVVTGTISGAWGVPDALQSGSDNPFLFQSAYSLVGAYVLMFNVAPSDAEVSGIVAWMAANPLNLPPSLLGRT